MIEYRKSKQSSAQWVREKQGKSNFQEEQKQELLSQQSCLDICKSIAV